MVEKKKTKKTKTDPGLYNAAELAATIGTVGSRVGELEGKLGVLVERTNKHEDEIADLIAALECRDARIGADSKKLAAEMDTKAAAAVDMLTEAIGQLKTRLLKLEPGGISAEPGTGSGKDRSLLDELRDIVRHEIAAERARNPLAR